MEVAIEMRYLWTMGKSVCNTQYICTLEHTHVSYFTNVVRLFIAYFFRFFIDNTLDAALKAISKKTFEDANNDHKKYESNLLAYQKMGPVNSQRTVKV